MDILRKNEIYEAEITGYTSDGFGVCRICGRAVFVPNTIAGERWRVRITKVTESTVWGRAEESIALSPERVLPDCPHAVRCGGCTLRHMSYNEELRFKLNKLNDALKHIGGQTVTAETILGSERVSHYRNKGIYTVRNTPDGVKCGFFAPRTHELVPIDSCLIQSELSDRTAAAVASFMNENELSAYDEETGRGSIRSVFVRCAENTPDCVAVIVTAQGLGDKTSSLTKHLLSVCPELTGIVLNVNKTRGNTVLAGKFYTLFGSDTMRDSLCGTQFEISPQAFYQINPKQAERLYEAAVGFAELTKDDTALDLYCGAGTISLVLARSAGRVIGAEIVPEAIENAKKNAKNNGIENAEFICADANKAAVMLAEKGIRPRAIVVDPPRRGMDDAAVRTVCGMEPDRVVYVSCNPATLARDIKIFNTCGYELKNALAVDMFPRTSHVETVVLMSRA